MSYAQPSDIIAHFSNRDLVQLTNEDPTAASINADYLQTYLNDASAEINRYLEARFTLPLADVPEALPALCIDIAMYKMQALRPLRDIEDARKRYEDAIKVLNQVKDGELTLGLTADNQEPPIAQAVETVQGPRKTFTRDRLKGF